ncbi:hypothetical protein RB200_23585 [Streptomyces sp. PmtG]
MADLTPYYRTPRNSDTDSITESLAVNGPVLADRQQGKPHRLKLPHDCGHLDTGT